LEDRSLDINNRGNPAQGSALHKVCEKGDTEVIQMLLSHRGIDVNLQNNFSHTPLMAAMREGRREVVRQLLADPRTSLQSTSRGSPESCAGTGSPHIGEAEREELRSLVRRERTRRAAGQSSDSDSSLEGPVVAVIMPVLVPVLVGEEDMGMERRRVEQMRVEMEEMKVEMEQAKQQEKCVDMGLVKKVSGSLLSVVIVAGVALGIKFGLF
jgi:hypothetical protein